VKSEERRVKNSTALLIIKFKVQSSKFKVKSKKFKVMKKILFIIMLLGMTQGIMAQPQVRRQQAQQKAQQSNANNMTTRAQISFPTAAPMDEDVVWRRDIYRELDLNEDANAGLYYPVEPIGNQMNLFTSIFRLMMTGKINVYQYRMDGNESFAAADRVQPLAFLDNYHIYYEKQNNGRIKLDNSDIPSSEVKAYYIKESTYYDQRSATFHTKVLALCPIMTRDDDFGDGGTKYPLFWVKYDDLAPFLAKQQMMTSNLNNAAVMSVDDYFIRTQYKGKIYKTNNMLGKTLAQYCPNDSAMTKEQKRIEAELAAFEKNLWGDQAKKDSLDSIANAANAVKGKAKVKNRRVGGSSSVRASKSASVKTRRSKSSSSSNGSARVTVRRERH
jgi:gliding motility associated protien GldN